jgi:O-antigen ligase
MIALAGIINVLVILKRNMREFALVGSWALMAIAVANWEANQTVTYTAIFTAAFLFASAAIHAFKNRATSPVAKIMQHLNR